MLTNAEKADSKFQLKNTPKEQNFESSKPLKKDAIKMNSI